MHDAKARLAIENAIANMGFKPKRVRVPFIARSTSRYDPHQGIKERKKAQKRLAEQAARERLQNPERLPV